MHKVHGMLYFGEEMRAQHIQTVSTLCTLCRNKATPICTKEPRLYFMASCVHIGVALFLRDDFASSARSKIVSQRLYFYGNFLETLGLLAKLFVGEMTW